MNPKGSKKSTKSKNTFIVEEIDDVGMDKSNTSISQEPKPKESSKFSIKEETTESDNIIEIVSEVKGDVQEVTIKETEIIKEEPKIEIIEKVSYIHVEKEVVP